MAADEILGISGHMDISDIKKSIDNLNVLLDTLGNNVSKTGNKLDESFSKLDLSKANEQIKALDNEIQSILNAIKANAQEISDFQSKISAAKDAINKGGDKSQLTAQIKEYENAITSIKQNSKELVAEHDQLQGSLTSLVAKYNMVAQAANAGQTASTAITGAGAAAHAATAVAVGAEAVAHAQNAKDIKEESESVQKSTLSFKDYEDRIIAVKQRIAELQQKILETKENIRGDKNDVEFFRNEQNQAAGRYGSMSSQATQAGSLADDSQQRVNEQTKALQRDQLEVQKLRLELAQLKEEQSLQAKATEAQNDAFSNIIAKMEQWKASLSDIDSLNKKFASQKDVVASVTESINELGNSSKANTEYAKSLKDEIESMSRALRLNLVGEQSKEQEAAVIESYEKIKAKIAEYSEAVSYASGQANAAVSLQKEAIAGLETQLSTLGQQLQAAQATDNTEAARAITAQIDALNDVLVDMKKNLASLESQSSEATRELDNLANVKNKMNEGAGRGASLFGTLTDSASAAVDTISNAFSKIKNTISEKVDETKEKVKELKESFTSNLSDISSRIGFDRLGEAFSNIGGKLGELGGKMSNFATGGGKFQESLGNIKTALNGLPVPLGNVASGAGNVVKALWAMCATPIGAILAAITVGLQAMYQWFTKSAEGQQVFTKITAYLGSLLSSLTDILVTFGGYLYHAFADAKGPMHDFSVSFAKTFTTAVKSAVSLLKGLGNTLKGIFTLDWDTFTTGLSQTWDGLKKAGQTAISGLETGIKGVVGAVKTTYSMLTDSKLGGDLGKQFSDIIPKAGEAARLAADELNTNIKLGKEKEKQATLDAKINAMREKIYTLTGKAKDAAIEETKALLQQKYDGQIKAQQQLYEIQKKRNALHTSSLEDLKKERELHIDVLTTIAQQAASTRMLTRMQAANNRKMESESKANAKKDARQDASVSSALGKANEVVYKNSTARIKAEKDLESELTDARISAMKDGAEKIIAERKRQLEKEIEQIEERKNAAIKAERDMQKAEFDAAQSVIKAQGGKAENWDESKHLDTKPIQEIEAKYTTLEQKAVEKSNNETLQEELRQWNDYVDKYGSIQQRIYAITEEYKKKAEALRGSGDMVGAASAEEEMKAKLSGMQMEQIKGAIDWDSVFQDLDKHSVDYLERLRKQLKTLLSSGTLNVDDMGTISEQINKIDDAISEQKNSWGIANEAVREHRRLLEEAEQAQIALNHAQDEYVGASMANTSQKLDIQGTLASVGINAQMSDIKYSNKDKYLSQVTDTKAQEKLKKAFEQLGVTEVNLAKSSEKVATAQEEVSSANDKARKTFKQFMAGVAEGLAKAYEKIKDLPDLMANLGLDNTGVGQAVSKGVSAVGNAASAAADYMNGNYVGALTKGISALQDATSIFGIGADNTAKMQEKIDILNQRNSVLADCLEKLNDTIENSSMFDAAENFEKQRELIRQEEKNSSAAMIAEADKHGTWRSSLNKSVEDNSGWISAMAMVSKILGKTIKSSKDFLSLTADEMEKIRNYSGEGYKTGELFEKILEEYLKEGGTGGRSEKLPDMISEYIKKYAGAIKDIDDSENTLLTNISFDNVKEEFSSMLSDMTKSTKDFTSNFEEMMRNAIVNTLMRNKYNDMLETWYNQFSEAYKNDHQLTPEEINKLREEYDRIAEEAVKERDSLSSILGVSQSSQSATSSAIQAITADQADTLTGIGYAMQIALEQGNETRVQISADISVMRSFAEVTAANISEMRDIQYEGLNNLQQIAKNTAPIILISDNIQNMYKLMKDRY